jgi:hypothetical protein
MTTKPTALTKAVDAALVRLQAEPADARAA